MIHANEVCHVQSQLKMVCDALIARLQCVTKKKLLFFVMAKSFAGNFNKINPLKGGGI